MQESIEVVVAGVAVTASEEIRCEIAAETLGVWCGVQQMVDGPLHAPVAPGDCSWSAKEDAVTVTDPFNLLRVNDLS